MPNWCGNTLTLAHPDPAQIKRVEAAIAGQGLLNEFVPVPEALKNSPTPEEVEQNMATYGYGDWYDFCNGEWGTKWDVDAEVIMATETTIDICFDSAWGPPIGWYERMMDLGFEVDAYYYEPGMGFCGHWSYGHDDYYEIGATSVETQANVPSDIDDMFSISESQWEYEQENRDELQAWIEDAVEAKATDDHTD